MAEMFYSLEQVMDKLGKSKDEVKDLIQQGKLREFRDGEKMLFKIDQVDALAEEMNVLLEESSIELSPLETTEFSLGLDSTASEESEAITEADTRVDSQGISVLGETDIDEYQLTDDTKAETHEIPAGDKELGKIEDDVSLDSFGSGSGLLDLSLQADDTSLGADILDDIYPGDGADAAVGAEGDLDVAAEAEQMFAEATEPEQKEEVGLAVEEIEEAPQMIQAIPAAPPAPTSNAFGIALVLPLLVVIYTVIVVVASAMDVKPVILTAVQDIIWWILGGLAVLAVIVDIVAWMMANKAAQK
jgi:excisionase family DNA binding protein